MELAELFRGAQERSYKAGETILRQDDVTMWVYFIRRGLVREYVVSAEGVEMTVNYHKPGGVFPHTWSLEDKVLATRFEAHTGAVLAQLKEKDFSAEVKKNPGIIYGITEHAIRREKSVIRRMGCRVFCHAYTRIIDSLLYLADNFGTRNENGSVVVTDRFTQKDIAALAGVTRETASIELGLVSKKGLALFEKGKIDIPQYARLKRELEDNKERK